MPRAQAIAKTITDDLGGQGLKPLICGGRAAVLVELGEHASDEDLPTTCHRPAYWSHSVIGM